MADQLMAPPSREGDFTSEQRWQMTHSNYQRSIELESRRQKQAEEQYAQQRSQRPETAIDRRIMEQQRQQEAARVRGEMTRQNHAESEAFRAAQGFLAEAGRPVQRAVFYDQVYEEDAAASAAPDTPENDIDIDIPTPPEPSAEQPEGEPSGKKKKDRHSRKKQPKEPRTEKKTPALSSGSQRATAGKRFESTGAPSPYPSRITTGGAITLGVLTSLLIGTVIYGRVQTNELYTEIAKLQTEYDSLVEKNMSMKSEMEGKMTVKNIQEYAENVLGLRWLDQSQIEYIQLQTEDEVVITEPEDNFFVVVNDYFVSFWEFLRGR